MSSPIFVDLKEATERLSEVLDLVKTEVVRDSAIKRFEICFDLAWKAIKNHAKQHGLEGYSPRECFKVGYQLKLIDYEEGWLRMINDRNTTVHLYTQELAEEVYSRLPRHLELFKKLVARLNEKALPHPKPHR